MTKKNRNKSRNRKRRGPLSFIHRKNISKSLKERNSRKAKTKKLKSSKLELETELLRTQVNEAKNKEILSNIDLAGKTALGAGLATAGIIGGRKAFKLGRTLRENPEKVVKSAVKTAKNATGAVAGTASRVATETVKEVSSQAASVPKEIAKETKSAFFEELNKPTVKNSSSLASKAGRKFGRIKGKLAEKAKKDKALRKKIFGFDKGETLHKYLEFRIANTSDSSNTNSEKIEFSKRKSRKRRKNSAATRRKISQGLKEYHARQGNTGKLSSEEREQRRKDISNAAKSFATASLGVASLVGAANNARLTNLKLGDQNTRAWIGTGLGAASTGAAIGGGFLKLKQDRKSQREDFANRRRRNRLKAQSNRNERARILLSAKKRKVDPKSLFSQELSKYQFMEFRKEGRGPDKKRRKRRKRKPRAVGVEIQTKAGPAFIGNEAGRKKFVRKEARKSLGTLGLISAGVLGANYALNKGFRRNVKHDLALLNNKIVRIKNTPTLSKYLTKKGRKQYAADLSVQLSNDKNKDTIASLNKLYKGPSASK